MKNNFPIKLGIAILSVVFLSIGCRNDNHSDTDMNDTDTNEYIESVDSNMIDTSSTQDSMLHHTDSLHHTY